MDTLIHESDGNNVSYSESNFLHRNQHNLLRNVNSVNCSPLTPDDRLKRLKEELFKSMNNIKTKREEIKILEKQLEQKNQDIKELRTDENKALVELNQQKDQSTKLQAKVKSLEIELERIRGQLKERSQFGDKDHSLKYEGKVLELENKNDNMRATLEQLQTEFEQLNMKYNAILEEDGGQYQKVSDLHTEIEHLRKKNISLSFDNENLLKKLQKKDSDKVASLERSLEINQRKCQDLMKQLEQEKLDKQDQLNALKGKELKFISWYII